MHYSKEFINGKRVYLYSMFVLTSAQGSSCLGLDLNMDNSMGTPSFEFPSVWVDVENYQSQLIEGGAQQMWISPDDCPEVSILIYQIVNVLKLTQRARRTKRTIRKSRNKWRNSTLSTE